MDSAAIAKMLQEFLSALGFDAMARDVATETDFSRLQQYARVVLKQSMEAERRAIHSRFAVLRLV